MKGLGKWGYSMSEGQIAMEADKHGGLKQLFLMSPGSQTSEPKKRHVSFHWENVHNTQTQNVAHNCLVGREDSGATATIKVRYEKV